MFEKLLKIIKDVMPEVDTSNVTMETRLMEDLHFDSLAMMMLAMNIEDEFGINFEGAVTFVTVKDVCDYLDSIKK